MNVITFGATGWLDKACFEGVLRECLLDAASEIERDRPQGPARPSAIESELTGLDTSFFCLGVLGAAMSEENYRQITYMAPSYLITTEQLGRAMLVVAKRGAPNCILESTDIIVLSANSGN